MANDSFPAASDLTFDEIAVGQSFELVRSFSLQDVLDFAALSGDYSPLHVDSEYAARTEFGLIVVHGVLLASMFSQLVGMRVPGKRALSLGQELTYRRPVLIDETVRAIAKVAGKSDATRILVLNIEIRSADDKVVAMGTAKVKVRDDSVVTQNVSSPTSIPFASGRRVAIVTGASSGIGAQISRTLASRGLAIAVTYFDKTDHTPSLEVVREIELAGGVAFAVQADVRDPESVSSSIAQVVEGLGPPQVLVNAAVGELMTRPISDLRWADFVAQMERQVKAVLQMCQGVYPHMKSAGGGAIVNVLGQVVAGMPAAGTADHLSATNALMGLSKAMASEWAEDMIRVNMVSPGLTRTVLTEHHHERVFKMEAARTPLKRIATPVDVANAVAYLAGEEASFLTGVNLSVTGGQVML